MTATLAEHLKSETRDLHVEAERSVFMRTLLRGQLPRLAYCALLHNLHAIYAALESALVAHAAHPGVAPVFCAALHRRDALARDLAELGAFARDRPPALQATARRYVAHLEATARRHPERLVAHAYVRYLGDLSGGQMLARIVAQSLQLRPGQGTRFYDFGAPAEVRQRLLAFRAGLDAIPADAAAAQALAAEARLSFRLHCQLFDELAGAHALGAASAALTAAP